MLLVRIAPGVELRRPAPGGQAHGTDPEQLPHPGGEGLPVGQPGPVVGPERLLGRESLAALRGAGVLKPSVGVRHLVPEKVLDQIQPLRCGVLDPKRSHSRTLIVARYQSLTKNPQIALYS